MRPRAQWKNTASFAEIADAVDVRPQMIMAVYAPRGPQLVVLYTRPEDESIVYSVVLERGGDGRLYRATEELAHPEMLQQLKDNVDRHMAEGLAKYKEEHEDA